MCNNIGVRVEVLIMQRLPACIKTLRPELGSRQSDQDREADGIIREIRLLAILEDVPIATSVRYRQ